MSKLWKSTGGLVGLRVVRTLGEYRIENGDGTAVGAGMCNEARVRRLEQLLLDPKRETPDRDSTGAFVWSTFEAANRAMRACP